MKSILPRIIVPLALLLILVASTACESERFLQSESESIEPENLLQPISEIQKPTSTPLADILDPNFIAGAEAYLHEDYEEVIRLMTLVIQKDETIAPAYWHLGMAYYYLHQDYQTALVQMQTALDIDPDYALAYADRGLMYANLGNIDQAMEDWQKAIKLDPTLAKVYHNIGITYQEEGQFEVAIEFYSKALSVDPTRASAWAERAGAYSGLNDYEQCITDASKAIELDPDYIYAYGKRGNCAVLNRDFALAIPDLNRYLEENNDDYTSWFNRGLANNQTGNKDQALSDYTQALVLNPNLYQAYINRSEIHSWLGNYQLALEDGEKAVALGEIPGAYMVQGRALLGLNRLDEAEDSLLMAIELLPSYGMAYSFLTNVYTLKADYESVINTATSALELDYQLEDITISITYQHRGYAYLELGNYDQAVSDFAKSIEATPRASSYYYRARAYESQDQIELAIADYETVLQIATESENAVIEQAQQALNRLKS